MGWQNLVSIIAQSVKVTMGNAYMWMHIGSNSVPALEMSTGSAAEQSHPALYAFIINPGAANETEELILAGPASTFDGAAPVLFLDGAAKNGSTPAGYSFTIGGVSLMIIDGNGVHIEAELFGTGGTLTIGDNVVINGTLSANGSSSTSTNGLPNGTITGTSGAASAGTAHTHSPGSFAVTNGQHSHTL